MIRLARNQTFSVGVEIFLSTPPNFFLTMASCQATFNSGGVCS